MIRVLNWFGLYTKAQYKQLERDAAADRKTCNIIAKSNHLLRDERDFLIRTREHIQWREGGHG